MENRCGWNNCKFCKEGKCTVKVHFGQANYLLNSDEVKYNCRCLHPDLGQLRYSVVYGESRGKVRTIGKFASMDAAWQFAKEQAFKEKSCSVCFVENNPSGSKVAMIEKENGFFVYFTAKLTDETEQPYLLKIDYSWGEEEPDQEYPTETAAWLALKTQAMKEADICSNEGNTNICTEIDAENKWILLFYGDGETCRYSVTLK